jgi:hypothetical protein
MGVYPKEDVKSEVIECFTESQLSLTGNNRKTEKERRLAGARGGGQGAESHDLKKACGCGVDHLGCGVAQ